jgi:amidase
MLTALGLARRIAARELSAEEVVRAHLERIEETKAINAVVALNPRALDDARAAPDGPLHGVPFTVKDNIAASGLPMAIGVPERSGVVADTDATVVARLKQAGAILLGKTNCPPWGGGIETDNPVYGRTNNPYDLARTPGGSSGGEAAIVAAGGSPCGLGTDSGASIRLPAHFCGLAALKPTTGRVPLTGVLDDEGQLGTLGDPRTVVGPLARSIEDVALLFELIAGPDGRDAGVVPVAGARRPPHCAPRSGPRAPIRRRPRSSARPPRCSAPPRLRRRAAATSSRSRSGVPTAAGWTRSRCTACCAAGTRSARRCSRSWRASTC